MYILYILYTYIIHILHSIYVYIIYTIYIYIIYIVCYSASHAIQKSCHTNSTVVCSKSFTSPIWCLSTWTSSILLLPSCRHYWGTLPLASLRRAYVHLGVSVHQSLFTSQSEHWSLLNATRRRSRYQGHEFNEAFLYHSKRGNWHTISFFNLVDPPRCPGQIRNLRSIKSASWGQDLLPKQTEGRTKFRLQK